MPGGAWKLAAVALLAASLTLVAPAAADDAGVRRVSAANALESGVLVEINALRRQHGLAPLRLNRKLTAAADGHSLAMVREGFFAHESSDGTAFWRRVERRYASKGFGYWSVGENLLWASPDVDARKALQMWLDSPPHRKNLLTPRWREIGLSAVHATSAPGSFNGMEVTVLTADFGVRR